MKEDGQEKAPELVLDDASQSGFIKWFRGLKQDSQIVRFFDRKSFYSVHGDHAFEIAQQFYNTKSVVKQLGSSTNSLAGVTLSRNLLEVVLKEFLIERAEYTVELYEGHGSSWRLVKSASPGRLDDFEEDICRKSELREVPVILAVTTNFVDGQRTIGAAYVDPTTRHLGVCQFHDDEELCCLETLVVQLGARECVIPKESENSLLCTEFSRIKQLMSKCRAMASERPKSMFSTKNLEQDLGRLIKGGNIEQHRNVLERALGSSALAAVVSFSELLGDSVHHGKFTVDLHDLGKFLRLDYAGQRALNVFPQNMEENKLFSLYGLMNRARTPMGKRRVKVWLKQPLINPEEINKRLDVVESLVLDGELRQQIRDALRGLPDVERLARKLERQKCTLSDLCQLYRVSSKLPSIENLLRSQECELLIDRYAVPFASFHDEEHLMRYEQLIEAAVDLDKIPDEYLVSPAYDDRLQELRGVKEEAEECIKEVAGEVAKDLNLIMDKSIKLEWHRMNTTKTRCLRITQKEERMARSKLKAKYTVMETRKDGVKFTNAKMTRAAQRLQSVTGQYEELQTELVSQVLRVAATFLEVFEDTSSKIAELDALAGFADLAMNAPIPYVRPEVLGPESDEIVLKGCRHPLVEAQDGIQFIENDCEMTKGDSWFQIITGPNMGGKSTFIRQVGVAVLMAQVGSFVPCHEAKIAARDCIFARVGAGDCQLRGVSTFMAEMLETAAVLKGATERSLVIIDELGRGTSTCDGFGLAWAISEHIMQVIGCPTLFATHFHGLTTIKGPVGVKNLHVQTNIDENNGRLTMLYQVGEGACDKSFGVHVAEHVRFPPETVALAKQKLSEYEAITDEVVNVGDKRKRTKEEDEVDACERAKSFFRDVGAINIEQISPNEAVAQVHALLAELESDAVHNEVLKSMLEIGS